MTCTEEYKEHIEYTFQAFCKVVIRNAAITAARTRSRKHKREISLEYLHRWKTLPFRYSRKRFPSARAGRGIHHPDLRRYGHTEQWFTCGSPLPATGLETGNGLSFLFPAYPTEGDRQAIRAEPQRSGLPYSQGCPAASRRNGGNDA